MRQALVIDKEPQNRRLLKLSLERNGYEVHTASSDRDGLRSISTLRPDIILLDITLPYPESSKTLADIRALSSIPVVVLSVDNRKTDAAALLDAGADDYVLMPFNLEVFLARINVVLRRTLPLFQEAKIRSGDLTVNLGDRSVTLGEREIRLTATEYAILACLARNHGKIVAREKLLKELWGPLATEMRGSLRVHLLSLRRKIEKYPSRPNHLVTERGIGYILAP